jgi:hypothetical protein
MRSSYGYCLGIVWRKGGNRVSVSDFEWNLDNCHRIDAITDGSW